MVAHKLNTIATLALVIACITYLAILCFGSKMGTEGRATCAGIMLVCAVLVIYCL